MFVSFQAPFEASHSDEEASAVERVVARADHALDSDVCPTKDANWDAPRSASK